MITKEAIEAGVAAIDRPIHPDDVERILVAALAAMPGPAVKVKPLEWSLCDDGETYEATSVLGRYAWWPGYFLSPMLHDRKKAVDPSAAAQADYEARILSALTPAPDLAAENESLPQDVVNLVIAAREFWDVAMDESDESAALDCALEAFSSRVPYENEPEEDRAALERT